MLALWFLIMVCASILAPGLAIIGLAPISLIPAGMMVFSIYKTIIWAFTPVKKQETIEKYAREISDKIE